MRCPNCQRLILNNTPRCPYCGQVIGDTKSMFETNPMPQSAGVPPLEHHEAVTKEVKKRHWQRWVFYVLIIALFLGAVGLILKIENDNSNLLLTISQTKEQLTQASTDLRTKTEEVTQINESYKKAQDEINLKTEQYKKDIEGQTGSVKDLKQCKLELTSADANIYNLILNLGTGIASANLARIPLADANLSNGLDTDQDGLSDEVEAALGTDPSKADTDDDTFNDKDEVLSGFDPLKANASLPIDQAFATQEQGKILIAIEGNKDAWYVSPSDGKRYFLGRPADGYKAMRSIEFWTKNYKQE